MLVEGKGLAAEGKICVLFWLVVRSSEPRGRSCLKEREGGISSEGMSAVQRVEWDLVAKHLGEEFHFKTRERHYKVLMLKCFKLLSSVQRNCSRLTQLPSATTIEFKLTPGFSSFRLLLSRLSVCLHLISEFSWSLFTWLPSQERHPSHSFRLIHFLLLFRCFNPATRELLATGGGTALNQAVFIGILSQPPRTISLLFLFVLTFPSRTLHVLCGNGKSWVCYNF